MKSFGNLIYTPCDSDGDDNPVLTEILLSRLVYEFGETTKCNKNEINLFKQDADNAMDYMVKGTENETRQFFQILSSLGYQLLAIRIASQQIRISVNIHERCRRNNDEGLIIPRKEASKSIPGPPYVCD
ncbi:hypothetical protein IV203_000580 [Nitzschia inconspicua]|uniref:Uncharacterized protein n=1 Tax=Nitzschia inconspicua TaxID=303405 RepID=A0A9K3L537_9STRA|nr:hypothetical protein IV203_000580 [Nitzschia inconspicua]